MLRNTGAIRHQMIAMADRTRDRVGESKEATAIYKVRNAPVELVPAYEDIVA